MKIAPHVYLVGSGHLGLDLTEAHDCNVYLFAAGDTYVLFDAGAGLVPEQMIALCEQAGLEPNKPGYLFLSHAHADHSGGAKALSEHFGLSIYASEQTAVRVEQGDEASLSLDAAKKSGLYPSGYLYKPFAVHHTFEHRDRVLLGEIEIDVIYTPGHSDDHHAFLVRIDDARYLVAGDAIFHGGKIVLQNSYDCNVPKSLASIHLLSSYQFSALLPGHGSFSLQKGKRHIETARRYIARGACPPLL